MKLSEFKFLVEKFLCEPPFTGDFPTTGKYGFPQLAKVNLLPETPVLPFNYLKSTVKKARYWYHCFTAEKYFHRLYNGFRNYVELLKQTKGLISADFSLFRDYPEEFLIANCRANRLGIGVSTACRSIQPWRLRQLVSVATKRHTDFLSAA